MLVFDFQADFYFVDRVEKYMVIVLLYAVAAVSFVVGGRFTYRIYTTSNIVMWFLLVSRIGKKMIVNGRLGP